MSDGPEDRIVWFHAPSGTFTTKAGYSWLILRKMGYGPHRFYWKAIWKLKFPPKIRVFAWRAGHDILPTSKKIASIIPSSTGSNPRCGGAEETVVHALKESTHAREAFKCGGFDNRFFHMDHMYCVDWLEGIMRMLDRKAFECLVVLLWNIWNNKNNLILQGKNEDPRTVWEKARAFCSDYRIHNFFGTVMLPKPARQDKWSRPSPGVMKINTDAAWDCNNAGIGIIARDQDGFVHCGKLCFVRIGLKLMRLVKD